VSETVVAGSATTRNIQQTRAQVTRTPKVGFRGQLTNSAATLYTAPVLPSSLPTGTAQASAVLKSVVMCNTDSAAQTVTLYAIESGGSAADNRAFMKAHSIAANTTETLSFPDDSFLLSSGEFIQGLAGTMLKVTVRVHVIELT